MRLLTTATVIGRECVGKSMLAAALTGGHSRASNWRGSTIVVERYAGQGLELFDTPGLLYTSDAATTKAALGAATAATCLLVVAQATRLAEDLRELMPLAQGRRVVVVVTFWDKVRDVSLAAAALDALRVTLAVPIICVDARALTGADVAVVSEALQHAPPMGVVPSVRVDLRVDTPAPSVFDLGKVGRLLEPCLAALVLLAPAVASVMTGNRLAAAVEPWVQQAIAGPAAVVHASWPTWLAPVAAGPYGLLTMGPLLLVWTVPVVVLHAILLSVYKTSGLLDRLATAMHPIVRRFGLGGRDIARVVMGFGCNVPAVIATRSCATCTRPTTMAVIAFGSACSYQMGATLGVFSAAGHPWLALPFALVLGGSALLYARLLSPVEARRALRASVVEQHVYLTIPNRRDVWRESRAHLSGFFTTALPVFVAMALVASVLDATGLLARIASSIAPVMAVFRLPPETALAMVLASVRKDGLLLLGAPALTSGLSPSQLLTAVFLGGVWLPCLVTAWTIGRESSWRRLGALLGKQAAFATAVALLIAWVGPAVLSLR